MIKSKLISVALMLKAPRNGQVKTRLARSIGPERATKAYRHLVEHQIRQIPNDWDIQIHFSPADAAEEMQRWLGTGHTYRAQPEGDLGQRLGVAMETHFGTTNEPLVFLGADCPYLTTTILNQVHSVLAKTEVVLIPALDGGYCLLALKRPARRLFHNITWNTGAVANETRQRLREEQIEWEELHPLEDVDDESSWDRATISFPALQ